MVDFDSLFAYQTEKIVRFKVWQIGATYYCLLVMIVVYIFGFEILYNNGHFDKRDVSGTPRLTIRHPTVSHCNPNTAGCNSDFRPLHELPYCNAYQGLSNETTSELQQPCMFADKHTLLPHGVIGGNMLVPTSIERTVESQSCNANSANNYTCDNEFTVVERKGVKYVADIERYSVLISHSYRRDTLSGNNNRVLGYYFECEEETSAKKKIFDHWVMGDALCMGTEKRRPIECIDESCHFDGPNKVQPKTPTSSVSFLQRQSSYHGRRGREGASEGSEEHAPGEWNPLNDGVYAVPDGDVFTVEKLLKLAGVESLDTFKNLYNDPLRRTGTVLDIAVKYGNLDPLKSTARILSGRDGGDVRYEYVVTMKPMHEAKDELVFPGSVAGQRVIEIRHGLYFTVRVEGFFGFFSIMNLLLALAQAATMLTVATVLTDQIAIRFMGDGDENYKAKYHEVERHEEKPKDS